MTNYEFFDPTLEDLEIVKSWNNSFRTRDNQRVQYVLEARRENERLRVAQAPLPYASWRDYVRAQVWAGAMSGGERAAWISSNTRTASRVLQATALQAFRDFAPAAEGACSDERVEDMERAAEQLLFLIEPKTRALDDIPLFDLLGMACRYLRGGLKRRNTVSNDALVALTQVAQGCQQEPQA